MSQTGNRKQLADALQDGEQHRLQERHARVLPLLCGEVDDEEILAGDLLAILDFGRVAAVARRLERLLIQRREARTFVDAEAGDLASGRQLHLDRNRSDRALLAS